MENILILIILVLAVSCVGCMLLGVALYWKGMKRGIVLSDMIKSGYMDVENFTGQPGNFAEKSLIEEERKEKEDDTD